MKIVMILDQIQSGLGTKDDRMLPLGGKKEPIGPGVMMAPFLREFDGQIAASLYCGNGTFASNPEEVSRKLCGMVKKLQADLVICGPAFDYAEYAKMCAKVAWDIQNTVKIPVLAAMSAENAETIAAYKGKIPIVRMPKKGGLGLNDALKNICHLGQQLASGEDTGELEQQICF